LEEKKSFSASLKKKLLFVNHLNKEKGKLEDEFDKEYNLIKHDADAKYRVIFDDVSKIVKGDELKPLKEQELSDYGLTNSEEQGEVGIPEYWGTAIKNSKYFPANDKDDEILKHLVDIRIKPATDSIVNYTLEFEFRPNEFFAETVLSKSFVFNENTEEVEKTIGCPINWTSPEKNPRIKITNKKVKKGKKVEIKKTEKVVPSFFDIFADQNKEDTYADDGSFFKEDLLPNSFEYYLDILDEDMGGEDFEDEDDEGIDDDDDDDEEEKHAKHGKKPKGKGNPTGGNAATPGDKNEKCKNQ